MEWILLFVFSILLSLIYTPVQTFLAARAASNSQLASFTSSNVGKILLTGSAFFVAIIGSAFVLGMVGKKPRLPG
jgi:hypothetical protein